MASSVNSVRRADLGLLNAGQTLVVTAGGATYYVTPTGTARNRRLGTEEPQVLRQGVSVVVLDCKVELCAPSELCVSSRVSVGAPMEIGRLVAGEYVRIDETDPVEDIRYCN